MTIKVNYDPQTTLVKGYYPDSINYASIPEPFIEIENSEQDNSKQMCVVAGVYKEYVKPLNIQLQEAKTTKLSQCKSYLLSTDWYAIRKADNGTVIPTQIAENRELARTLQDDINACTTIEELNSINIEF